MPVSMSSVSCVGLNGAWTMRIMVTLEVATFTIGALWQLVPLLFSVLVPLSGDDGPAPCHAMDERPRARW